MEFKDRLKALRKEFNMQQRDLGRILNYGSTAISNYESGRNEPSIGDLVKIAECFNVSLDYLLCVNDIRTPYVKRDYPESFDRLKTIYSALNENNQALADDMLQWLFDKQLKEKAVTELKVAQNITPYKTKNSSK